MSYRFRAPVMIFFLLVIFVFFKSFFLRFSEQLKSFLCSLTLPVHLTQGPPGTGKSYLGVVIVRALMVIRNLWMNQCPQIGEPDQSSLVQLFY